MCQINPIGHSGSSTFCKCEVRNCTAARGYININRDSAAWRGLLWLWVCTEGLISKETTKASLTKLLREYQESPSSRDTPALHSAPLRSEEIRLLGFHANEASPVHSSHIGTSLWTWAPAEGEDATTREKRGRKKQQKKTRKALFGVRSWLVFVCAILGTLNCRRGSACLILVWLRG